MIRTLFRWVVRSAVVAGAAALVVRLLRRGEETPSVDDAASSAPRPVAAGATKATTEAPPKEPPEPLVPEPPAPEAGEERPADEAAWVPPEEGSCPPGYPIKAKEASGIFHVPGGLAYDRTVPDRCYRDVAAAEADGYRQSKR